jgi:hypothetical protein
MNNTLIRTGLLILACFFFGAPSLYFELLQPPAVNLPGHIESMALVDRSQSSSGFLNFIETGELNFLPLDRPDPLRICMNGLADQVNKDGYMELIRTGLVLKRPGSSLAFPKAMDCTEVSSLCDSFRCDALLVLEFFHVEFLNSLVEARAGYRIYDPVSRRIVDQIQLFQQVSWRKTGWSPDGRELKVSGEEEAYYQACYFSGVQYGRRILPAWSRVERFYFDRPVRDTSMAYGIRMMEVHNWEAAQRSLQRAAGSGHPKTEARAAHNLAVVFEALGDYPGALEWAQLAWAKYGLTESREYALQLNRRLAEIEALEGPEDP